MFLHLVRSSPRAFGIERTRWRLEDLREACPWLQLTHAGSLSRLLCRLKISYKRAREHVHSPDPDYLPKLKYVFDLLQAAGESGGKVVVTFLDELTYYRQPSPAPAYERQGKDQPPARRSHGANTATRVIAAVDALTGRVTFWQGSKTGLPQIAGFYKALREAHAGAERIYVAQDNWPIHFHPDVLCALEEQERPFPFRPCPHWSTEPSAKAVKKWGEGRLPVQIVPLPTYAPWTNPIEKLWRWGKQEVLHLHPWADQVKKLREQFSGFLTRFEKGSKELLRYIGLADPLALYSSAWEHLPRAPASPY